MESGLIDWSYYASDKRWKYILSDSKIFTKFLHNKKIAKDNFGLYTTL